MKTLFIPAKVKSAINIKKIESLKLPKNITIAYSVQYEETALKIKQILSKKHNITDFVQVLGCSKPRFSKTAQAILLISSGEFHAISLASENNIPVYVLEHDSLRQISKEQIDLLQKKKKASYMKFLNSEKVGILVSTKPGQENLKRALSLKLKNKDSYLFLANEINTKEFENFPDIQSWINTACPRLDFDSSIINIRNL
ncbi:2-(3-amino-3-carboxypropyl)histidine synthase subunit [Candidatus Pacearchaeota archaeon]|nr:2-(3-amino-3-carboxypropyl)histidine synthase subunit [Candidatus Pacearchaeota archaeon]